MEPHISIQSLVPYLPLLVPYLRFTLNVCVALLAGLLLKLLVDKAAAHERSGGVSLLRRARREIEVRRKRRKLRRRALRVIEARSKRREPQAS